MRFTVPPNHKFACLALSRANIDRDMKEPMDLEGGCWAVFGAPLELDSAWKEWLGSIRVEYLSTCTLSFCAVASSKTLGILDDENQNLIQIVSRFFYALLMAEIFHYEGGLVISGANVDGRLSIRSVSNLESHYLPPGALLDSVSRHDLLDARRTADGIRAIHVPDTEPPRLARGLRAWIAGLKEFYGASRLHQFVRAVEAPVKPQIGRSRANFAHRGQLFTGNTSATQKLLYELYDLRSHTEHMNPLDSGLTQYLESDRFAIALERSFQAQALASHVYRRILQRPDLISLFSRDDLVDAFWAKPWAGWVATWGPPFDIDLATRTDFQRNLLPLNLIAAPR